LSKDRNLITPLKIGLIDGVGINRTCLKKFEKRSRNLLKVNPESEFVTYWYRLVVSGAFVSE